MIRKRNKMFLKPFPAENSKIKPFTYSFLKTARIKIRLVVNPFILF